MNKIGKNNDIMEIKHDEREKYLKYIKRRETLRKYLNTKERRNKERKS
jgi:hypothetical protein